MRDRVPPNIFQRSKCFADYNLCILLHIVGRKLLLETNDSLSQTSNSASSPSSRWRLADYGNVANAAECEMIWSKTVPKRELGWTQFPNGLLDSSLFAVDLGFIYTPALFNYKLYFLLAIILWPLIFIPPHRQPTVSLFPVLPLSKTFSTLSARPSRYQAITLFVPTARRHPCRIPG